MADDGNGTRVKRWSAKRKTEVVLRSRTPELVRQEFYGFLLAHYAVRDLMHEAALKADLDPDTVSFTHTVRVVRRELPRYGAFSLREESDSMRPSWRKCSRCPSPRAGDATTRGP